MVDIKGPAWRVQQRAITSKMGAKKGHSVSQWCVCNHRAYDAIYVDNLMDVVDQLLIFFLKSASIKARLANG